MVVWELILEFRLICSAVDVVLVANTEVVFPGILVWLMMTIELIFGVLCMVLGLLFA